MNAREVVAELDRLGVSIFCRSLPDGSPAPPIRVGGGADRVYPELRRAIEERTPDLLRLASFRTSLHVPGTYVRRPGDAA